jgi:hypothetical protein
MKPDGLAVTSDGDASDGGRRGADKGRHNKRTLGGPRGGSEGRNKPARSRSYSMWWYTPTDRYRIRHSS